MSNATYNGPGTTRPTRVVADPPSSDGMVAIHGDGWAAMVEEADIERDRPNQLQTTITVQIPGWGASKVTPAALDAAIARYLPASPDQLRSLLKGRGGYAETDFDQVTEVSTALVILADWDHNVDDDPRRVG